jgi:hypothetical protein
MSYLNFYLKFFFDVYEKTILRHRASDIISEMIKFRKLIFKIGFL